MVSGFTGLLLCVLYIADMDRLESRVDSKDTNARPFDRRPVVRVGFVLVCVKGRGVIIHVATKYMYTVG